MGRWTLTRLGDRREVGAAAIMVAMSMVGLCIVAAMVLDFGLVRFDKQSNKAVADAGVAAGIRALDGGNGEVKSFRGACEALNYTRANLPEPERSSLTGTWTTGSGASAGNPCISTSPNWNVECDPTLTSTWAVYTGSADGGRIRVTIKSGYKVPDPSFPEDPGTGTDLGDSTLGGCDQLAVIISERENASFGRVANVDDITTAVRTVGRVIMGADGQGAVALLMLEREKCPAINTDGSASVVVYGNGSVPGLIHSDSLGKTGCSSTSKVINGNHADGIVAHAAEDELSPGVIGVRAMSNDLGAEASNAADPIPNVYAGPYPPGTGPTPRGLTTRGPIDTRYREPVQKAISTFAKAQFALTETTAPSNGFTVIGCNPTLAQQALAIDVFVNCPGNPGFKASNVTLQGQRIIFNGKIDGATNLSMPNATQLYVAGFGGVGVKADGFRVHHQGRTVCGSMRTSARAQMFVRDGSLTSNGGLLQMCNTTVILMGGQNDGCLPDLPGTYIWNNKPCASLEGTGSVKIGGTATQDWTAPNSSSVPLTDYSTLEDLALWTESYGNGATFQMAGSGTMTLSGIFMTPNADPFNIKGGGGQNVRNSQYIARSLNVTGNGTLELQPDPHDVVTIPIVGGFMLVR